MSMQINAIILYGKNGQVRSLPFRLNDVNIVTGKSGTGKTALSDIIDYCLGRNTCNVAHGVIRNTVEWYALHLHFPEVEAFVARRNPLPQENTNSEIVYLTAKSITPPAANALVPNITEEGLNDALSVLTGITPNKNVPGSGETRRPLRATLDHAKFLIFQGQSEIFDRDVLFHRAKEQFIPQTIKDTLPYFLGAVADTSLVLRERLRQSKQELGRLQRQQVEAELIAGEGNARAEALLSEAIEAGLLASGDRVDARSRLKSLGDAEEPFSLSSESYSFGEETGRLRSGLVEARQQYQDLQHRIQTALDFNTAQSLFETAVQTQADRLEVVGVVPGDDESGHVCPLCQSRLEEPVPAASDLQASLEQLRSELEGVGTNRPRVDEYLNDLRAQQQQVRQRMVDARQRINAIETQSRQAQLASGFERRQALVLGRVSLYLETVPQIVTDATQAQRIEALETEIDTIERRLQNDAVRERVDSALSRISIWMTAAAQSLEMEYRPNPHRIDIGLLTVVADTDVRPVRMTQMGSAANWLGCHLIAHVALQKWFALKKRPVPRFLFLDQPTSAYYPADNDVAKQGTDEDRAAVERMYKWFIDSVQNAKPDEKFQLIIVDHADLNNDRFQKCVVERWRGEDGLIPKDWTTSRDSADDQPDREVDADEEGSGGTP